MRYRHRRDNDDDENFIALAPAEGDDFNLESVLTKDKELSPPIVRLNSVSNEDDIFNRYFDNGDIIEERRIVMNETTLKPMQWLSNENVDDNTDEDDEYPGKSIFERYCDICEISFYHSNNRRNDDNNNHNNDYVYCVTVRTRDISNKTSP